jgi:hypothetical protein
MANEDIINKIKALRAKVNNAASTEAEVEAAARMVAKLMMQHDVTEDLLTEKVAPEGVHAASDALKNDLEWVLQYCWKPIQDLTETKSYRSGQKFNYIGLPHDVEMALYLFELVTMSAKRGWLRHSAKMFDEDGMTRTKGARVSYYVGFGERMAAMLNELHEERQKARPVATGTAVVIRKQDIIKGKMREMGLQLHKSRGKSMGRVDGNAYNAGQHAASQVNLNRPFGATKAAGTIQ